MGKWKERLRGPGRDREQADNTPPPEERESTEQKRIYRTFTTSTQYSGFSLFSDRSLVTVVSIVMILLQFVSFLTTWAGSSYFLHNIASKNTLPLLFIDMEWLPPLIFALSIQIVLLFVSNAIRRRATAAKCLVLLVVLFCSTFTSYVGVYKTVNPPSQYLDEEYRQVDARLAAVNKGQIEDAQSRVQGMVNGAADALQRRYSQNEKELATIAGVKKEIDSIKNSVNTSFNVRPPQQGEDYEEYVRQYQQYLAAINSGSGVREAERKLQILSVCQDKGYESEDAMLYRETELTGQQTNIRSTMDSLCDIFGLARPSGEDSAAAVTAVVQSVKEQVAQLGTANAKKLSSAYTAMLSSLEGGTGSEDTGVSVEEKQEAAALMAAIASQSERALSNQASASEGDYVYQILPSFKEMVTRVQEEKSSLLPDSDVFTLHALLNTEIQKGLTYVNQFSYIDPTVFKAEDVDDARYTIPNMMLYPLYAFALPSHRADAIVCLLFAALFDGLTVLLALLNRKQKSLLFARKNSDVVSVHEDIAEEAAISTALLQSMIAGDRTPRYAEDALKVIAQFIARFKPTFCGVGDTNFVYYAAYRDLMEGQKYNVLLNFLLQFNYARLVPGSVFRRMITPPSPGKKQAVPLPETEDDGPEDQIILLKSNFVLWFTQKYAVTVSEAPPQSAGVQAIPALPSGGEGDAQ